MLLKFSPIKLRVVILFIVCVSLFLVIVPTGSVFAHESSDANVEIIHIDEHGFSPRTITVEVGTKITFENIGLEDHWPASDDHPSHTLYDGTNINNHCDDGSAPFDSCSAIPSSGTWSFVFVKEGKFGFHDHLWPHFSGEIEVLSDHSDETEYTSEDEAAPNDSISFMAPPLGSSRSVNSTSSEPNLLDRVWFKIQAFISKIFPKLFSEPQVLEAPSVLRVGDTSSSSYTELKKHFENVVINSNPHAAIKSLQEQSEKNPEVLSSCHDFLHTIGKAAYNKYSSFEEAAKYQQDFCNSGYIHGLFEAYFDSGSNLSDISNLCGDVLIGRRPFDFWQCYHGVGHGFMYFTGGDLDKSLALCNEKLTDLNIRSCQNGAYMEVFNAEILAKEKEFVDKETPFDTCANRTIAQADCYLYLPTYLSQTLGEDFVDIFAECNKVPSKFINSCIRGVGSEAIKRNMHDIPSVFKLCSMAHTYTDTLNCEVGVVGMYMNQKGTYESGLEICKLAPESFRENCFSFVAGEKEFFSM